MHPILTKVATCLAISMEAKTPSYVILFCKDNGHVLNWTHFCEFYWRTVRCQLKGYGGCEIFE